MGYEAPFAGHGVPGRVPIPHVPGLPRLVSGSPHAAAPSIDQHRKEILSEIGYGA